MADQDVIMFIDNNSARQALIKGYSPSMPSCVVLAQVAKEDAQCSARSWYARVPTQSNLSDLPSRLEFEVLRRMMPQAEETAVPDEVWHEDWC